MCFYETCCWGVCSTSCHQWLWVVLHVLHTVCVDDKGDFFSCLYWQIYKKIIIWKSLVVDLNLCVLGLSCYATELMTSFHVRGLQWSVRGDCSRVLKFLHSYIFCLSSFSSGFPVFCQISMNVVESKCSVMDEHFISSPLTSSWIFQTRHSLCQQTGSSHRIWPHWNSSEHGS